MVSPLPSTRKLRVAARRTRDKQPAQLRRRLARAHVAFFAFHAVERLRFLEEGKPHAYHTCQCQ